ncbi:hypothetical protein HMPREF9347_01908, partial [Escherichia coli MS 124-1]
MCSESIFARSMAALITVAPRSMALVEASEPLKLPIAVRTALTMTQFFHFI